MRLKCVLISAIVISLFFLQEVSHASRLLFTGGYHHLIREIEATSTNIKDIVTIDGNLSDLFYDPAHQSIYWVVTSGLSYIGRYNLQTQHNEILIDGSDLMQGYARIHDVAVDVANNRLYFSDYYNGGIYRSNLDGTGIETLVDPDYSPWGPGGFDIHVAGNRLYWCDNGYMRCANLDGTMQQELFSATCTELTIDHVNQYLYWTTGDTIMRSDLDGIHIETIISTDLRMPALVADPYSEKLFWYGMLKTENYHTILQSCNLDGTSLETVVDFGVSIEHLPAAMCLKPCKDWRWHRLLQRKHSQ